MSVFPATYNNPTAPTPATAPVPAPIPVPAHFDHIVCLWDIGWGMPCGADITVFDLSKHLQMHGVKGPAKSVMPCVWGDCGRAPMKRESVVRHVEESTIGQLSALALELVLLPSLGMMHDAVKILKLGPENKGRTGACDAFSCLASSPDSLKISNLLLSLIWLPRARSNAARPAPYSHPAASECRQVSLRLNLKQYIDAGLEQPTDAILGYFDVELEAGGRGVRQWLCDGGDGHGHSRQTGVRLMDLIYECSVLCYWVDLVVEVQ
ncbi:hypothetical protein EDB19DRAFT_2023396 [Suillus lakei]|nr:hypothetical protein EDB19DRAFT_2023396 [Suillus lakei]